MSEIAQKITGTRWSGPRFFGLRATSANHDHAVRRCAIYTRKSSEEGLEQAFNSLHAQREACEAYIKSQAHEGWKLVKTAYDDGGFSGGSMERPALQRLLADVAARPDRRRRGLQGRPADPLAGRLRQDRRNRWTATVPRFVSVTQQFNTTTSMGRLTLNVLLSFAQFEREVTGERIRDKIAASKRKGMWMGGTVPLGYDVKDRELVVNEAEAETVRDIFDRYIRLGSVAELRADLQRRGILSKRWTSSTDRTWGGATFSRGALYWLLRNPVYVGRVAHKGHIYEGRQAAIVEQGQWEQAQALLSEKSASRQRRPIAPGGRPLAGRLFDDRGNAMSPSYATKRNGQRYHYYVSQARLQNDKARAGTVARVPAKEIERLVLEAVGTSDNDGSGSASELLRQRVERVVVHADRIEIVKASPTTLPGDEEGESRTIVVPAKLAHRNRAVVFDDGRTAPDPVLLKALGRAHEWRTWLEQGEALSFQELASKAGVTPGYVQKVLPLAFLAPGLTRELLDGRRRLHGGLMARLNRGIPTDWDQQLDLILTLPRHSVSISQYLAPLDPGADRVPGKTQHRVRPPSGRSRDTRAKTGKSAQNFRNMAGLWCHCSRQKGRRSRPLPSCLWHGRPTRGWLAGAPGFEPGNGGIKIRCLTAWRRPNRRAEHNDFA